MHRSQLFCLFLIISVPAVLFANNAPQILGPDDRLTLNQNFRNYVIQYVRNVAELELNHKPLSLLESRGNYWDTMIPNTRWSLHLFIYQSGKLQARSNAYGKTLDIVLIQATKKAMTQLPKNKLNLKNLNQVTFVVTFDYPPCNLYSILEFQDQGLELLGNRIALRNLSREKIKRQIEASTQFLLNIINPDYQAYFQLYDVDSDKKDTNLRTIYTASALFSLINVKEYMKKSDLKLHLRRIADFLLSMQISHGENKGAFYYALNLENGKKECHVQTGTASKTIFSLLLMDEIDNDKKFLNSARLAGDWLLTKIKPDGRINHGGWCNNGTWSYKDKHSFLYSGQMLSALSRLYEVTKNKKYLNGAKNIAKRMADSTLAQNGLVGDDFRKPNTISTSWVTMAFIDFSKIHSDPTYSELIYKTADAILSKQINTTYDLYNYGRYLDTMTTSGNGWINEVMGEVYTFCVFNSGAHCERYRRAMTLTSRWLLQNAYTSANTFTVPTPTLVLGGFIRNFRQNQVRIDAVCHGLNSLVKFMKISKDLPEVLLQLPEKPFSELIGLLRIGNVCPFEHSKK